MKDKYFITGKTGFIGKYVAEYLKGEIITDSIENGCTMIHLAAYGNHFFQTSKAMTIKANVVDLYNLIQAAQKAGIKKFYNISTSSVLLPVQTMYSRTKMIGEILIDELNDHRFVNVRPYSVYGYGEAGHRFIPTIIRNLISGRAMQLCREAVHDWIHATDFVAAMFAGYTEIGTGEQYTNIEIVHMLEDISGKKLNYQPVTCREYDCAEWRSSTVVDHRTIYDGLKDTYEKYRQANS